MSYGAAGITWKLDQLPERYRRQVEDQLGKTAQDARKGARVPSVTPGRATTPPGAAERATGPCDASVKKTRSRPDPNRSRPKGPNRTELRFARDQFGPETGPAIYEGVSFRLPGGSRYTPDWITFDSSGRMHAWEVKGSFRFPSEGRARTAYQVARSSFPGVCFHWRKWDGKKWIERD